MGERHNTKHMTLAYDNVITMVVDYVVMEGTTNSNNSSGGKGIVSFGISIGHD